MKKVRYKVKKSGYIDQDEKFIDDFTYATFKNLSAALNILQGVIQDNSPKVDPDCFGIGKQEFNHIADGFYDWDTDDNFGESGSLKRLYEFQLKV